MSVLPSHPSLPRSHCRANLSSRIPYICCVKQSSSRRVHTCAVTKQDASSGLILPGTQIIGLQPLSQTLTLSTLHGREVELSAMRSCIQLHRSSKGNTIPRLNWQGGLLEQAYERCSTVTSEYAKTFYLGTQLMTPAQSKAVWAIYVWCRRTDELVDGPNADRITPQVCL